MMLNKQHQQNQTTRKAARAGELLALQQAASGARNTSVNNTMYLNDIVDVTGSLADILALRGVDGAYIVQAMPIDIAGCSASYIDGFGWVGMLGNFNLLNDLQAMPVSNLAVGKVFAKVGITSSVASYCYMSAGWVLESSIGSTGQSNVPGSPSAPLHHRSRIARRHVVRAVAYRGLVRQSERPVVGVPVVAYRHRWHDCGLGAASDGGCTAKAPR